MKQEHPFISIVIPTCNRPEQLAVCLRACSRLDYPHDRFEVIVVDDGGVMPLDEVVNQVRGLLTLKLLQQQNAGPAAARNKGAAEATGEFLAFTDDDCAPASNWLEALAAQFVASPDCAVGGQTPNVLMHNLYSTASQLLVSYLLAYYSRAPERVRFFPACNLAFPTERFRDVGGFNVSFPRSAGEDRELCDRWQHRGYQMIHAPEAVVYHSHHLTAKTFLRQHFHYGRAAYHYHLLRARRRQQPMKVEPPAFYVNMLTYLFGKIPCGKAIGVVPLLIAAQAVNAVGFCWEHARRKRSLSSPSTQRDERGPLTTRKTFRKLLGVTYVIFISLISLEVAVRIWGYSERHIHDPIYTSFDRTEDIPYIHKPNLTDARARGLAVINTDSLGLRVKSAGVSYGVKLPNEYRIAIVGDSVTFGEGVPKTEDTFTQVLEDALNQQPGRFVRVLNYGASAYSVKQMAASLEYRMVDIQPDLVVLAMIPEDLNVLRTPSIDAAGYLVDTRTSFLHSSVVRELLRPIRLMYLLREVILSWMSPSQVYEPSRSLEQGEIPESYRYVQRFKAIAEEYRIPYLVVLLPKTKEKAWGPFPSRLTQDGVTYLDLSPLVREFTRQEFVASRFDSHPSAAVHHRIAEALADYVQQQPGIAQ